VIVSTCRRPARRGHCHLRSRAQTRIGSTAKRSSRFFAILENVDCGYTQENGGAPGPGPEGPGARQQVSDPQGPSSLNNTCLRYRSSELSGCPGSGSSMRCWMRTHHAVRSARCWPDHERPASLRLANSSCPKWSNPRGRLLISPPVAATAKLREGVSLTLSGSIVGSVICASFNEFGGSRLPVTSSRRREAASRGLLPTQ